MDVFVSGPWGLELQRGAAYIVPSAWDFIHSFITTAVCRFTGDVSKTVRDRRRRQMGQRRKPYDDDKKILSDISIHC
jgi:hypothetical protein